MKFTFSLQHPLTCNPSTTLSNPCNKVRGEYIAKEVFLRPFFMCLSLLLLSRYDTANEYITFVRFGACASRVLQGFKTNLVTVNDSF